MGAFRFELTLKDEQVEEFISAALDPAYVRDGGVSDWEFGMRDSARYIAEAFIRAVPEMEQFRPAPTDTH